MTIASALTALNTDIVNARTAITNKGGTVTANGGSSQLATDIATIPTGTTPVIQSLNVTPTTSAQTITASGGVDGYSPVNVSAVTASIDANITAGNIKNGVTILNVTGNYSGTTPTGTLSITQNGTYDVTNYASADVSVSGGGGYSELPSYQIVNGVASRRSGALTGNEFSGITSVGNYGLQNAFYNCDALTGVLDLSAIVSVGTYGLQSAFSSCDGITSANLSSLTSVGNNGLRNVFSNDGVLRSVDLSSLTSVDDYGLYGFVNGCFALRSVDLASLTSIGSYGLQTAFSGCRALTDIYFRSLTTSSFANVNAFTNMMQSTGTTTTHTLHFPSNLQSTISGLSGYPLFGGTSGYVTLSFDLTETS